MNIQSQLLDNRRIVCIVIEWEATFLLLFDIIKVAAFVIILKVTLLWHIRDRRAIFLNTHYKKLNDEFGKEWRC